MQTIKSLSKLQGKLMKALAVIAEWWAMPSITLNKAGSTIANGRIQMRSTATTCNISV